MILTWKLWRVLSEPPVFAHAQYKRVVLSRGLNAFNNINWRWLWLLAVPLLIYLLFRHGLIALVMLIFVVPAGGVLAFLLLPVLLPPFTTLIGGYWAAIITRTIVKEHRSHTYELLCIAPEGTLGANWAIACGSLHRGDIFGGLRFAIYVALVIGGGLLVLLTLIALFMAIRSTPVSTLISAVRTIVDLAVVLALFYIHYVQSMVLSALVGVCAPALFENRSDAPWLAFGLFEVIQFGSYGLFALLHFLIAPALSSITPDAWLAYILVPVIYLVGFTVLREAIILALWELVRVRLNAAPAEREVLMSL
jgi:hypothetical protein